MDGLRAAGLDGRGVRAVLMVAAASAVLAACAGPRYAAREPEPEPNHPTTSGHGLHGTDKPYEIGGRWYYPHAEPSYDQVGLASWYGAGETSRHTADGEVFEPYGLTAAHKTLPLPSIVEVTNLANGRSLRVRLNDRGPFVNGRLIDLSRGAAEKLGFDRQGTTRVRVRYISAAPPLAAEGLMQARLTPRRAVIAAAAPVLTASVAPPEAIPAAALPPIGGEGDPLAALVDYRVQVGAYASRDDASRAAARLGEDVRYRIEPVEQQGAVLYRVVLGGYLDEDDALAAQFRFAEAGFPDARVIKPF